MGRIDLKFGMEVHVKVRHQFRHAGGPGTPRRLALSHAAPAPDTSRPPLYRVGSPSYPQQSYTPTTILRKW
ncbi:hypothetical protein SFRURICE_018651 [Spodoptera frugiperda]|nr:hypothetical protein SFRURICE_018651 [Spodoptera frugiperda]